MGTLIRGVVDESKRPWQALAGYRATCGAQATPTLVVYDRGGDIASGKDATLTTKAESRLMPTVLRIGPYRFFFYAGDRDEPPHMHVERDEQMAKCWLVPVRLQCSRGFSRQELNRVQRLVEEHHAQLLESWNAYFHD